MIGCLIALGFYLIAFIGGLTLYEYITLRTDWGLYQIWFVIVNILAFALHGLDKGLAKLFAKDDGDKGGFTIRVPEDLFHVLVLAGGFIGGLLGMVFFNSKTSSGKSSFRQALVIGLLIHIVFVYDMISSWLVRN